MRQIICVGDLCCDLIVPYGDMQQALRMDDISKETTDRLQVSMQCGGSVGNVARHLGSLGDNPIFITPLKMDSLGAYLSEQMQKAGVDMSWVSESERSNMYCVAVLDESGERTMFCFIPPWADYPRFNDKSFLRVKEGLRQGQMSHEPILFTSGMAFLDDADNNRAVLNFFKTEKENGATIIFDLNVRAESYGYEGIRRTDMEEMIALSDVVLGSGQDEFLQVTGCSDISLAAETLLERMQSENAIVVARDGGNPILVVGKKCTDQRVNMRIDEGNDTSIAIGIGHVFASSHVFATRIIPLPVKPVSTLGAGDSFDAKFLSELSRGENILTAVKNASDYAGRYISNKH